MLKELIAGIRLRNQKNLQTMLPEMYWIQRAERIVGLASRSELQQGRQVDTYRTIYQAIIDRSISKIIDLGCNIAALGQLMYDWGYQGEYVGVDTNWYALEKAAEALKKTTSSFCLVRGNIRTLPFADCSFNCVVMKDVLEHMEDFRALLGEAFRISSKYVIISNFIPWTEGKTIVRREPEGFYHNMYNRREVYSFARNAGFTVEEVLSVLEKDARANEVVIFVR